jgi:hypothetical protein
MVLLLLLLLLLLSLCHCIWRSPLLLFLLPNSTAVVSVPLNLEVTTAAVSVAEQHCCCSCASN